MRLPLGDRGSGTIQIEYLLRLFCEDISVSIVLDEYSGMSIDDDDADG